MSVVSLAFAFGLLFVLSLCTQGLFLWLACRWWNVAVRWKRIAVAVVLVAVLSIFLRTAGALAFAKFGEASASASATLPPGIQLPGTAGPGSAGRLILLCEIAAILFGIWATLKWSLRTTWKRSLLAGLTMLLPSIPVGLAMAYGVRATVAEAFVVPTGAMAPALIGVHTDVVCENCSFPYTVSLSDRLGRQSSRYAPRLDRQCPNCGWRVEVPQEVELLGGDRVLVEKISQPRRWDLIVFPLPHAPSVDYVKRLVALPGERLEVAGGDLFINGERLKRPPGVAPDMWIPLSDSRYVPREIRPEAGSWRVADGSGWRRNAGSWIYDGSGDGRLPYEGQLTDGCAYNGRGDYDAPDLPVADIWIECGVTSISAGALLAFEWKYAGRQVVATITASGEATLRVAADDGSESESEESTVRLISPAGSQLSFMVRDGDAHLLQDGRTMASVTVLPDDLEGALELVPPTERGRWRDPSESSACHIAVIAGDGRVDLSHIAVLRDVRYATLDEMGLSVGSRELQDFAPESEYGGGDVVQLGPDEFFGLGDNSRRSKDCRFFGSVRFDTIKGVVRCIYWPPGRWHEF